MIDRCELCGGWAWRNRFCRHCLKIIQGPNSARYRHVIEQNYRRRLEKAIMQEKIDFLRETHGYLETDKK